MVKVWIVRMFVPQARMQVGVRVRLALRVVGAVCVQMMGVVDVRVLMLCRLVEMVMLVPFAEMQV